MRGAPPSCRVTSIHVLLLASELTTLIGKLHRGNMPSLSLSLPPWEKLLLKATLLFALAHYNPHPSAGPRIHRKSQGPCSGPVLLVSEWVPVWFESQLPSHPPIWLSWETLFLQRVWILLLSMLPIVKVSTPSDSFQGIAYLEAHLNTDKLSSLALYLVAVSSNKAFCFLFNLFFRLSGSQHLGVIEDNLACEHKGPGAVALTSALWSPYIFMAIIWIICISFILLGERGRSRKDV